MKETDAFDIVKRSMRNARMPHAYIVIGNPRAVGLRFAENVAALLLCADPETKAGTAGPCGRCDHCQNVAHKRHADIFCIEPELKSRVIGIDVMREAFLPWVMKGSYAGGWKIGTILFADRMNDAAANAFLKTLEEPPERTLFLLVTDKPDALLPTIISRCQRLDLSSGRIPPASPWRERVGEILARHSSATELRAFATAGRFVDLFADITAEAETQAKDARRNADPDDEETEDTHKARVSTRSKEMRQSVYEALKDWYRDLLVLASAPPSEAALPHDSATLFYPEYRDQLAAKAAKLTPHTALQNLGFIDDLVRQIEVRFIRETIAFPYWFARLK